MPTDVADADQVEAAAAAVERASAPIDVWVNDAMATVFAPLHRHPAADEFKRATEVTYLGAVYGTMAALKRMTAARPRHDRAGRLGARLPRDPAAGRLLRREVRDPRLHRLDPHRTARRQAATSRSRWSSCPASTPPQFNWCRSKLPEHPQPVPPIYQPEIPAEAVYWAAQHRRRELWVGYSTRAGDPRQQARPLAAPTRYLARTAITGQQVDDMPIAGERPGNLFAAASTARPPPTASSTPRPRPAARSCGRRPTDPRVAGALAAGARRRPSACCERSR